MRGHLAVYVVCGIAVLAAAAAARASPPLHYVGTVDNISITPDTTLAAKFVGLASDAGVNSLRVIMPWTYPGQADIVNDIGRLCPTAAELSKRHMVLFLDVVPIKATPPDRSAQITRYDKTIGDYMWALIGPNGCAKNLAELVIGVGNEPNYALFCRPADQCPAIYTQMLARTFVFVHQQALANGLAVPVSVVGGELASSHDPVGFINGMHAAAVALGVSGRFFDKFSYHCYGTGGNPQATSPDSVQNALKSNFGWNPPLLCTEYGAETATPPNMPGYTGRSSAGVSLVSENAQGALYSQTLATMACKGLDGVFSFHLFDDPSLSWGWQSGLYYFDPNLANPNDVPVPKVSLPVFRQAAQAALSGSLPCG